MLNRALRAREADGAPSGGKRTVVLIHNTTYYLKLHYTELINCLLDNGWHVCCLAPRDSAAEALEELGVKCCHLDLSRRGINPLRELRAFKRLYGALRSNRALVVMSFSIKPAIYGSIAARLLSIPRIFSMITGLGYVFLGTGVLRGLLAGAAALGYRIALAGNQKVFFQNPDDRNFFVRRRIVGMDQAVVLNGTGIDTGIFCPRASAHTRQRVRFVMISRLLLDKGIREYAEAAERLKDRDPGIDCALLGPLDDNPSVIDEGELDEWVRRGVIDYLGETEDVASVICDYDVFVLPSYREGLPRATLEAMAMAKPVVTTDAPGCRETVQEGINGYLVPPRDAVALADAMARFVDDPSLIESMGRASRDIALNRFDVKLVNKEILRHIEGASDD